MRSPMPTCIMTYGYWIWPGSEPASLSPNSG